MERVLCGWLNADLTLFLYVYVSRRLWRADLVLVLHRMSHNHEHAC